MPSESDYRSFLSLMASFRSLSTKSVFQESQTILPWTIGIVHYLNLVAEEGLGRRRCFSKESII